MSFAIGGAISLAGDVLKKHRDSISFYRCAIIEHAEGMSDQSVVEVLIPDLPAKRNVRGDRT